MNISYEPPGKYYEDLILGEVYLTVSRTVTEADVMNFCGVSGDFNQLHTDIEFARETTFEKRIAHGLCGMAIASGCLSRTGLIEGTTVAFAGIENWMFTKPIFSATQSGCWSVSQRKRKLDERMGDWLSLILRYRIKKGKSAKKGLGSY